MAGTEDMWGEFLSQHNLTPAAVLLSDDLSMATIEVLVLFWICMNS